MSKKFVIILACALISLGGLLAIILSHSASSADPEETNTSDIPTQDTSTETEPKEDDSDKATEEPHSTNTNKPELTETGDVVIPSEASDTTSISYEPQNTANSQSPTEPEATPEEEQEPIEEQDGIVSNPDPDKGEYPFASICPEKMGQFTDPWGMYICESTSYVAWKVQQNYENMPYWSERENTKQWPDIAQEEGIPVSTTPKVGTAGIDMDSTYGHAVWIEEISKDESKVRVSQYNYGDAIGDYSEMWMPVEAYTYIYFGDR